MVRPVAAELSSVKQRLIRLREIFEQDPDLAPKMVAVLDTPGSQAIPPVERQRLLGLVRMFQGEGTHFSKLLRPAPDHNHAALLPGPSPSTGFGGRQKDKFEGKAVFVGLSEVLLAERKDSFYTVYSEDNGLFLSGVEIMATAFSNLLEDRPVVPSRFRFLFSSS